MKTTLALIEQTECDVTNSLREYEAAHRVWMDTPVDSDDGRRAGIDLDAARIRYIAAVRSKYPSWIVM